MIDVVIPAYNCSKTLGRTLSSLVSQTDTEFNVIVVDDCSTEHIYDVVCDYTKLLNIDYIRNSRNLGAGMSRQVGMDNSTSKFVTFLDSDDMFMPYAIETFNAATKANPDIEFLHTQFYEQAYIDGKSVLVLQKDNFTAMHGKLYNMDIVRNLGIRFLPDIIWSEDAFFNSMCTELMSVSAIRVPTMIWTYTNGSLLRGVNPDRDKNRVRYFVQAMAASADFVKQYKPCVCHLEDSVKKVLNDYSLSEDEKEELNKLLKGGQY